MQQPITQTKPAGRRVLRRPAGRLHFPLGAVIPLTILGLWLLALQLQWLKPYQLPSPLQVGTTLAYLAQTGELWGHLQATLGRLFTGFLLGAIPAVVLGLLSGLLPKVREALDPTLQALRAIPSLAWVPLFLLWFGIGETARVLLIALGVFLPVYLNTLSGVEGVDRKWLEVGQIYGLSRGKILRQIVLPGALPGVLLGLRSGLGLGWMFVVAAELIAANSGLGFLLQDGSNTSRPDKVLASLLLFAVLGRLTDWLLRRLEQRLLSWRDTVGNQ